MQIVTLCYKSGYRYVGKKAGGRGRFWKDEAHSRLRTEEKRYLAHGDWDGDVIDVTPVTCHDVA